MPRAFVSIGSNIDRETNVRLAVRELRRQYEPLSVSSVVETAAVGFDGEPFYNLVVGFETADSPEDIRTALRRIEDQAGRARDGVPRFGPRTLDLDLILYGNLIRHDELIDVPAADIVHYDFVLGLLAELVPDLRHPERNQTIAEMWRAADRRTLKRVELPPENDG